MQCILLPLLHPPPNLSCPYPAGIDWLSCSTKGIIFKLLLLTFKKVVSWNNSVLKYLITMQPRILSGCLSTQIFFTVLKPLDFAIAWITLCPSVQDHSAWHFGDNNILGLLLFPFVFLSTIFFWAIYFLPWFLVISSKKKIPTFNLKLRLLWSFTPNTWFPISPRMSQASPTQLDHIWVCC